MRVIYNFNGREQVVDFPKEEIIVGRHNPEAPPDLDLGADEAVSRRHARIWLREGHYWVEDLGSSCGTFVNGVRLDYRRQLREGDLVCVGETTLRALSSPPPDVDEPATVLVVGDDSMVTVREIDETQPDAPAPVPLPAPGRLSEPPESPVTEPSPPTPPASGNTPSNIEFSTALVVDGPTMIPVQIDETNYQQRLSLLFDLPLQFAAAPRVEELLQLVVERVVQVIPGAQRGALLLRDPVSGKYRLKAHVPPGNPAVSETLARRAIAEGKGFIWQRSEELDPTASMKRFEIATGMYAPLRWKEQTLGVLCVDNPGRPVAFTEADLRFLIAIAHYAASAVTNHQLQDELQTKSRVLERLLTNFSPKLRSKLLEKALAGKLRPGGEKSEVTILLSDIRGFTHTTANMDPQEIVDMLNDYFPPLVQAIFQHDGTIDKFVGDAILAVFGSPEADPHQHEKAVFAALAMQEAMKRVNTRRKEAGEVTCEIGIGIHCGEVLHGFVGAAERLEFTVIGDAVNKAARYCDGAKPGEVLISPAVFEHAYRSVEGEKQTIPTKHEGDLPAFRVKKRRN